VKRKASLSPLDLKGALEEEEALEDSVGRDGVLEVSLTHFLPMKEMIGLFERLNFAPFTSHDSSQV